MIPWFMKSGNRWTEREGLLYPLRRTAWRENVQIQLQMLRRLSRKIPEFFVVIYDRSGNAYYLPYSWMRRRILPRAKALRRPRNPSQKYLAVYQLARQGHVFSFGTDKHGKQLKADLSQFYRTIRSSAGLVSVLTSSQRGAGGVKKGKGHGNGRILSTTSIDESATWGMERAVAFEKQENRNPKDVSATPVHFDLESRNSNGEVVRCIEVKARKGNVPVTLTQKEFQEAKKRGEKYYLYVITDEHNGRQVRNPRLHCQFEEITVKAWNVKDWREKGSEIRITH